MTAPVAVTVSETDLNQIATATGRVAVVVTPDGKMDQAARRANRLTRGAVARLVEDESWGKLSAGDVRSLNWPAGMAAEALDVVCLSRRASIAEARKAGAALGKAKGDAAVLVMAGSVRRAGEMALGLMLRAYAFTAHKTEEDKPAGAVALMTGKPEELEAEIAAQRAVAEGVFLTRDLVNEPANHLTTTEFASRIKGLEAAGVKVTVLEEDELRSLGMHLLLSVGHGSASPSKVAVMEWMGGDKGAAPLALIGKGRAGKSRPRPARRPKRRPSAPAPLYQRPRYKNRNAF